MEGKDTIENTKLFHSLRASRLDFNQDWRVDTEHTHVVLG